jgi:ADP-dependent NAD(P)H-hydrate dehydratase
VTRPVRELDDAALEAWPLPEASGGKDQRGRVVVVGGSSRTPGAVLLAAEAAVRAGAGKPQVATVASVAVTMSVAMPEALVSALPETDEGEIGVEAAEQILELAADCDALLLGPGLLSPEGGRRLLEAVVPHLRCPVVVDALGTAFVTEHREGLAHLGGRAVLTPNEQELARMLGRDPQEVGEDLLACCVELAQGTNATVATGGGRTAVAAPDGAVVWSRSSDVPGLGVAGSGDVKAGIVLGLLGRGLSAEAAAAWAVVLHQSAGQAVAAECGPIGYLAREVLPWVPRVMARLSG